MASPEAEDASPSPEYNSDSDGDEEMAAEQNPEGTSTDGSPSQQTSNVKKSASNARDPLRPRRKKARRACLACQRAHLTCGDERPCHRCVKRHIADSCMDGNKKKAKYLHDTPNEALMPGRYPHITGAQTSALQGNALGPNMRQSGVFFTQSPPANYPLYTQNPTAGQLPPSVSDGLQLNAQQQPISPTYSQTNQPPIQLLSSTVSQGPQPPIQNFSQPLFDPSDPGLYNLDLSSLNFVNHYGALEFGMLGHMSSGAAETPPTDHNLINPLSQTTTTYTPDMSTGSFADTAVLPNNIAFAPDSVSGNSDWQTARSQSGTIQLQTPNNTPQTINMDGSNPRHDSSSGPHAYAIGQGSSSLSSASPASTDVNSVLESDNPVSSVAYFPHTNQPQLQQRSPTVNRPHQHQNRGVQSTALQPIQFNSMMRKRRRDTAHIYEGIKEPYAYVGAFHRLHQRIRDLCSHDNAKKILVQLSQFRPNLIATAGELDKSDLVHNERTLQRSLLSLEDMIGVIGTPTLVLRRTGDVVLVGKEFSILTGWPREVLLGTQPNMNVNTDAHGDAARDSGSTSRTSRTPIMTAQEPDTGPHPVNIIELVDDVSRVQFFEDFAHLAFEDAHGSKQRRVRMLKYRTKEMEKLDESKNSNAIKQEHSVKLENAVHHESGFGRLGAERGMVDCMVHWHIKRDTFELPMVIFMTILPVLA